MTVTDIEQWYEAETGHKIIRLGGGGYDTHYVDWLQRRMIGYQKRVCKPENCKYADTQADGIVFCGKCGRMK